MRQARFWIDYKGSIVRLKLNQGQIVDLFHGGLTDEGYSHTAERYRFEGAKVTCAERTEASDCDGRITRQIFVACAVRNLDTGWHDAERGVTFPEWQQLDYSQRDYSAEAMNY